MCQGHSSKSDPLQTFIEVQSLVLFNYYNINMALAVSRR